MPTAPSPRRFLPALALLTALALSGCASEAQPTEDPSASAEAIEEAAATSEETPESVEYTTPREMPEGKGSGEADGVFPRTVVHFAGETVIEAEPTRVVVISTGQTDVLLTLGITPVGVTSADGAETVPEYLLQAFPDVGDELASVTDIGTRNEPSVEKIALLEPDLILANLAGMEDSTLYDKLTTVAPTVITQGTGLYWKQDFLLIGDALGKADETQDWLDDYHQEAADFGASLDVKPEVSFLRKNGDRTRVFGIASFSGSVAEDIGLGRPEAQSFDDTSLNISNEELAYADGDWIFFGVQGGNAEEITSLSLWETLDAVQNERVVQVDDDTFYLNTGPTAARGILAQLQDVLA